MKVQEMAIELLEAADAQAIETKNEAFADYVSRYIEMSARPGCKGCHTGS